MKYLSPRFLSFSLLSAVLILSNAAISIASNIFEDKVNSSIWEVIGPSGGDVRSVVIDPKDKDRLYISTLDGQIYTSPDSGKTWSMLVNLNKSQLIIDNLLIDRTDSNRIFASGNRGTKSGGFFYTTDRGRTWKEVKKLGEESIHSLTQADEDPKVLFLGTRVGVWRSKDSGEHWEKVESTSSPKDVNSLAIDPNNTSTIYAGTTWRPYKSTDAGKSWKLIKTGMIDDSDVFAISINKNVTNHLFASACSGIYESKDGGENWRKIQGIPSTSRRTRDILINPADSTKVYAGTTEGFWMSADSGKTWSMTTQRNLEINSIAVHPDLPNRIFIGTNNYGMMVSHDGGRNWTPTNGNFTSRFTYSVTADLTQPQRLFAITRNTSSTGGFVFLSKDTGKTWAQVKGLDFNRHVASAILQDKLNQNKIYLGTNVGLFVSIDRGMTWSLTAIAKKPTARKKAPIVAPQLIPTLGERINVLAYTEDEKNGILAGTDKGIYRSYDLTKGWEKLPISKNLDSNITAIYASSNVPGTIWAGTAASGVIVSTDDGKTWTATDSSPNNISVSSVAGDPKQPNNIYVGTLQSIYVSRDGGRSWSRRGGKLPIGNYTSILINPNNSNEIFAANSDERNGGVFFSNDFGTNWKRFDSKDMNLPSRRVWSLAFDPTDTNRIFAGSHSSGVYIIQRKQELAVEPRPATQATGN